MSKEKVEQFLNTVIREFAHKKEFELPPGFSADVVVTRDVTHGDFSSNIAFKLARLAGQKPSLVADEVVLLLEDANHKKEFSECLSRVEVAGGGFINFYLTKTSLAQVLLEVRKKDKHYGYSDFGKGKKVLVEFVSANPTGPLTIAHGRQAAVGDALVRILRAAGFQVTAEYYLNDAGRQMNLLGKSLWSRYNQELGNDMPLPEDGYQGGYLIGLAKKLVEEKNKSLLSEPAEKAIDFCRQYAGGSIMDDIRDDLKNVRVHFDSYFNESSLYQKGAVDGALNDLTDRGHLYEKDGALWFHTMAFGDDKDRVVKKSTGEYTYLAPDIAYHKHKFDRGYEWLINFLGPDHHGYIVRLKAACQALGYKSEQLDVRIAQLTTLYRKGEPVRMSTRAGEFVTLRELYSEVGVDATRCFFVMRKIESHLDFDLELAKAKSQDNPVFYLQYAHARIASLLKYANASIDVHANLELLSSPEETALIKVISEFSQILIQASQNLEPYRLADYLRELAASFHKFYAAHRIVSDDSELTKARLLLTDAVRIAMRNGLELLGISQPESM